MNANEQRKAAREFVARWQAAEGSEDRESRSFWIELCQNVLGIASPTMALDFERRVKGRKIDVFYEDMGILIENKSRGIDLDVPEQRGKHRNSGAPRMVTPFQQAKWYADNITPRSVAPKWVVVCNFDEIRIHDLDREDAETNYESIRLEEIPDLVHRFSFFTRKENSRLEREKRLSIRAGEVVGRLYDAFSKAYLHIEESEEEQRSLNILITRIVFLLYAEDADLLQEKNAFYSYLKNFQVQHMRQALIDLFATLRTPEDERDPYLSPELAGFPYVNGGLFEQDIIIPHFSVDTRHILLQEASVEFDWSDISPTIFGAVFESTLNPETRRAGGMHYTSIENIHKVTGPLFFDALKDELTSIEGLRSKKERDFRLNAFRRKIAAVKVLDPACGSGNFLTETYLSLRKLENRVLENLYGGQMAFGIMDPIQVTTDQFFGIEINDFAVEVAKTALWIAELQMIDQTREILSMWIDPLPLKSNENIVCANALRMDWNDVLPAEECNYIIGNPPFVGQALRNTAQSEDMASVFGKGSPETKLDYVICWYRKALEYMDSSGQMAAFVSTNSICQGESVPAFWRGMVDLGAEIQFAYRTFVWNSEAPDKAAVHCVIVGFSKGHRPEEKGLFAGEAMSTCKHINAYLIDAPDIWISGRGSRPRAGMGKLTKGSEPTDDGNLILTPEEKEAIVAEYPQASLFIRPFLGAKDFLNGDVASHARYCLWLAGVDDASYRDIPDIVERLRRVRGFRLGSKASRISAKAESPGLFCQIRQPKTEYIVVPRHSSSRRTYIPLGFMSPDVICGDSASMIPSASLFQFGVMMSRMHNVWTAAVCGRIKSDYRYSPSVYNNYVWPDASDRQRLTIVECARNVLEVREAHPGSSLAKMYDGISPMPSNPTKADLRKYEQSEYADLLEAHRSLDAAVEAAYGVDFGGDEARMVAHLFRLYAEATGGVK